MTAAVGAFPRGYVKVCGVTRPQDADVALDAGADAIGINLWPRSPRSVDFERAAALAEHVRGRAAALGVRVEIVTVSVDADVAHLDRARRDIAPDRLQVHGLAGAVDPARYPELLLAVGLGGEEDVARALAAPGPCVLVDARDQALRGGTGRQAPRALAARVCAARPTLLAGGLGPDNVAEAIAALRPHGVDAASRLEQSPGHKDPDAVRRFVAAARAAFAR